MPISIRNPRVEELARALAKKRNQTMTEVIVHALERERVGPDADRLRDVDRELALGLLAKGKKPRPVVSKKERDAMWGQE